MNRYFAKLISLALILNVLSGCATHGLFSKKDKPNEIKVDITGTFNQIYYKINKLDNDMWSEGRTICIPITKNNNKIVYYVIKNDWFAPYYISASTDTDNLKSALTNDISLKSIEVINYSGMHRKDLYAYLTYDKLNSSNKLKLYPDKVFKGDELVPNDFIPAIYFAGGEGSIKLHGNYYSHLVRNGQYQVKSSVETDFNLDEFRKLLTEDSHKYNINIMDAEADYQFPIIARIALLPFAVAIDIVLSPFTLLMTYIISSDSGPR